VWRSEETVDKGEQVACFVGVCSQDDSYVEWFRVMWWFVTTFSKEK